MPTSDCSPPRRGRHVAVPSLVLALIAALAIVLVSSSASSAQPPTAPTAPAQRAALTGGVHGSGYTFRGQWFGSWRIGSKRGFCIEFDRGHPNSGKVRHAPGQLPRFGKSASARAKYIVANYGETRNKLNAAGAAIAVWKLQNTARFNKYYKKMVKAKAIPKSVQRRAAAILAASKNYGPYKLSMTLGSGLPGMTVAGAVTIKAANGKLMSGRVVSLAASNAAVVNKVRSSNSRGQYTFRVRVAAPGAIKVTARLATKSSRGLWMTSPSAGHQRLAMAGTTRDSASAFRSSVRSYNGSRMANGCDGDCNGIAPITTKLTNACGSATMLHQLLVNGKVKKSIKVVGCRSAAPTLRVRDADVVTMRYCYLGANGKCTSAMRAGPRLVAVCPPMATFKYTATCACKGPKKLTFTVVGPQLGSRKYTARLEVSGQPDRTLAVSAKQEKAFPTVTTKTGTQVKLSVTVLKKTTVLDSITIG